MLVIDTAKP